MCTCKQNECVSTVTITLKRYEELLKKESNLQKNTVYFPSTGWGSVPALYTKDETVKKLGDELKEQLELNRVLRTYKDTLEKELKTLKVASQEKITVVVKKSFLKQIVYYLKK